MFIKYSILRTILSPKALFHTTKDLSLYNKIIIILLVTTIVGVFVWWSISIYNFMTVTKPTQGGQYVEALVGQPRYVNPLLSHSSSSDRSLTKLIFSGLFDYDENGILRNDIADRFEVSENGKVYTVFLKNDIKWHDEISVTADDVTFTIDVAKDIAYGAAGVSNDMRLMWHNIIAEKVDDYTVKFTLEGADNSFLHNLTLGLLPKHIWKNIEPEQFQLSEYNQKPIGSGPYKFVNLNLDTENDAVDSYILKSNERYHRGEPFITKIITNFYPTRADAVEAYKNGEVSGVMVDKREYIDALLGSNAQKKSIELPHYFAVFFNQTKSVPLAFDEVREALAMATDKDKLVGDVFGDDASVRNSPFADGVMGFDYTVEQKTFDLEGANKLLDEKGWNRGDDGIRSKDDTKLSFVLHISDNHQEILNVAEILKEQWLGIGVDLGIQKHEKGSFETNIIKPRDYDAVLYAHQMNFEPNLRPLWHGKEKEDPGVNYALFDNDKMNETLDKIGTTENKDAYNDSYKAQQEIFRDETPAVFLFAPKLSFMYSESIKDIRANRVNTSYDRYVDIQSWYIKEKRVRK